MPRRALASLPRRVAVAAAVAAALALGSCDAPGADPMAPDEGPPATTGPSPSAADAEAEADRDGDGDGGPGGDVVADGELVPGVVAVVQPSVVTVLREGGNGSGVVYTADGLILTNEHVVRGADGVEIAFADGRRVPGTVEAADPVTDIALVRAGRTGLPPAEFRTDLPRIGELAIVIGSPLGFEGTVTVGVVSGLHRSIPGSATRGQQSLVDLIQTDAAISPGNSGGAVVDRDGRVIGISEAYIPPQTGAVSLGFAIPAATAVDVADQLRETGAVEHAFAGIVPGELTTEIGERLGLPDTTGTLVLSVVPGGPAAQGGLAPGDVIVAVAGEEVDTPEDFLAALRQRSPGEAVAMTVRRGEFVQDLPVTLAERP